MKHADTRTECWGFQLRGTTKLRIVGPVSKWLFSSFKSTISMSLSAAINIKPPAVNQVNYQVRQTPWQHRPCECRTSTHHIKLRVHRVVHLVARQNHVFRRTFNSTKKLCYPFSVWKKHMHLGCLRLFVLSRKAMLSVTTSLHHLELRTITLAFDGFWGC